MTSWVQDLQVWEKTENHFSIVSITYVKSKTQFSIPIFKRGD